MPWSLKPTALRIKVDRRCSPPLPGPRHPPEHRSPRRSGRRLGRRSDRPGDPRRPRAQPARHLRRTRPPGDRRPRRQAGARRLQRRHLHHQQPGALRHRGVHPHRQPTRGGDPGHRGDRPHRHLRRRRRPGADATSPRCRSPPTIASSMEARLARFLKRVVELMEAPILCAVVERWSRRTLAKCRTAASTEGNLRQQSRCSRRQTGDPLSDQHEPEHHEQHGHHRGVVRGEPRLPAAQDLAARSPIVR